MTSPHARPDTTPDTRLVLIRHGESVAQVEGFLSGHDACKGLSDRGREQVVALRDRLISTGELGEVDVAYTSVLRRAVESAEILSPAFGEVPVLQECDWCEIHAGEAEGLTWDEYFEQYPVVGDPSDPFGAGRRAVRPGPSSTCGPGRDSVASPTSTRGSGWWSWATAGSSARASSPSAISPSATASPSPTRA